MLRRMATLDGALVAEVRGGDHSSCFDRQMTPTATQQIHKDTVQICDRDETLSMPCKPMEGRRAHDRPKGILSKQALRCCA